MATVPHVTSGAGLRKFQAGGFLLDRVYCTYTAEETELVSSLHESVHLSESINLTACRSSWNLMAHGGAREGNWRGNWRMEWVASTLHTTSERGVSSVTTADANTSAASSRLNWRPRRFKWTLPFRRKTKSGFCSCAITFKTQSTSYDINYLISVYSISWLQFMVYQIAILWY